MSGVSAQVASHNSFNLLPREKSRANSFRRLIFPRESLREVVVAYTISMGNMGEQKVSWDGYRYTDPIAYMCTAERGRRKSGDQAVV